MYKKTITYEDFNGEKRTDTFYFNLTKTELMEMEIGAEGGMSAFLERIVKENDNTKIFETFKEILLKAYGEKSDDGRRFIKNEQLRQEFESMAAYSELAFELMNDENEGIAFIQGVIPAKLEEEMAQAESKKPQLASISKDAAQPSPSMTREQLEAQLAALKDKEN